MSSPPPKPWITRSRHELYDARPWLRLYGDDVELPDGQVVQGFYSIDMPDHAIIVALTEDGRVVVERNYKHGPRQVCVEPRPAIWSRTKIRWTARGGSFWKRPAMWRTIGRSWARLWKTGTVAAAEPSSTSRAEPDSWLSAASGDLEEMVIDLLTLPELFAAVRNGETPVLGIVAALGLAAEALGRHSKGT